MRRVFAALAATCLACATTPSIPPVVVDGYRLYARQDRPGVHSLVLESRDGAEPLLRLLDAYCAELHGDVTAAEGRYRSIAGLHGWVLLDYAVRSDGTVTDAVALESEPPFVFDRAAVAMVGQWLYEADETREPFRRKLRYEFWIDRIGLPRVRDDY